MNKSFVLMLPFLLIFACVSPEQQERVVIIEKTIIQCWDNSLVQNIQQCPPFPTSQTGSLNDQNFENIHVQFIKWTYKIFDKIESINKRKSENRDIYSQYKDSFYYNKEEWLALSSEFADIKANYIYSQPMNGELIKKKECFEKSFIEFDKIIDIALKMSHDASNEIMNTANAHKKLESCEY